MTEEHADKYSEEQGFLNAISAQPDDIASRLVYADWLEDQGDARSEYVRLQVRLAAMSEDDPQGPALRARLAKMRADHKPYWLALLDPPVWCVVGNIVTEARGGQDPGKQYRGTPLFRPGAKIYLADMRRAWALPQPGVAAPDRESIIVIGQHRKSRKWIQSYLSSLATTNWRIRLIHHPGAMACLRKAGWLGFHLRKGEFTCEEGRSEPDNIAALLQAIQLAWNRHYLETWKSSPSVAENE